MSRCFPFPPPGYEKRLRNSEQESLLSKEKHKERKRKKERKGKGQVENKERNDSNGSRDRHNDGSRDKHKEKKDKKEKHKDKKRKREKDKNGSTLDPNNETHMANEVKDSKFAELGRRIRDDEQGAANCLAKNISNTSNRRIENNGTVTSTTVGKESFTANKTVATGSISMRTKIDRPIPPLHQSRADGSEIPSTISEKQKTASRYNIQEFTSLEKRNGKHAIPFLYKRTEGIGTPASIEKQIIGSSEKRFTPPNDKHTPLFQNRRTEGIETLTSIEKQKIRGNEKKLTPPPMLKKIDEIDKRKVQINQKAGSFATEDRRNHAVTRPFDKSPSQKGENAYAVDSNRGLRNNNFASNANGLATKSDNELDWLVESITSIPESMGGAQATEKERRVFPNIICTETENKNTKDKLEDAKTDGRHKDRDGKEKNKKEKDKDRHEKKEKKKKMKIEQQHTNHDKLRDIETKDQINNPNCKSIAAPHLVKLNHDKLRDTESKDQINNPNNKSIVSPHLVKLNHDKLRDIENKDQTNNLNSKSIAAPHLVKMNASSADGHNMKRKEFIRNGLLHEPQLDERPSKLPRIDASSSHQLMKNGNTSEFNHGAIKLGSTNNFTIKRGMETNGNSINGKAKVEIQPSHIPNHPPIMPITPDPKKTSVAIESSKKEQIRTRPPHRDTKYLDTIYSIPKMEEIAETKEQDWLFGNMKSAAKAKFEANKSPPKVWAKGLRIDEADVFALPYVVPF